ESDPAEQLVHRGADQHREQPSEQQDDYEQQERRHETYDVAERVADSVHEASSEDLVPRGCPFSHAATLRHHHAGGVRSLPPVIGAARGYSSMPARPRGLSGSRACSGPPASCSASVTLRCSSAKSPRSSTSNPGNGSARRRSGSVMDSVIPRSG